MGATTTPTVLLVSPDYTGRHSVGAERMRKFAKYLPEFGFHVCVLTATKADPFTEEDVSTYRTFDLGHVYRAFFRRGGRKPAAVAPGQTEAVTPRFESSLDKTVFSGVRRWMLDNLLIPDLRITWLPWAVWKGRKVVRREAVDIILSSGPPHSVHLAAGRLAALTGKPWIADFRDGWLFEPLHPLLRTDHWRRRLEAKLERWVVRHADAVVSVSQPIGDYFGSAYSLPPARNHVIPNGFDPADWDALSPVRRDTGTFRVVYTGSFFLSRLTQSPEPVLAALRALSPGIRAHVRLVLVGALTDAERSAVQKYGLGDVVQAVGLVSRSESLAYQLSADCLLLMVSRDRSLAPSKLYEYLFSRRPILAISPADTAAAEIVRKTESGKVVAPDKPEEIAAALAAYYELWKKGDLTCRPVGIEGYERRELTRRLAEICRGLLREHPLN